MSERRRRRHPPAVGALAAARPMAAIPTAYEGLSRFLERGRPRPAGPPWMARLLATAETDLALLAASCHGSPFRAAAASLAVLEAVWGLRGDPPEDEGHTSDAATASAPRPADGVVVGLDGRFGHAIDRALVASEEAERWLECLGRLAPFVGWHTHGTALAEVAFAELDSLSRLIARRPEVQAIADALGQLEAAASQARGVERGGREAVVGVRFGGDLADVLPCELMWLADPETEDLFFARFAERRLLSYELAGELDAGMAGPRRPGPVIACVDTSGSMRGEPERYAKALILAVARRVLAGGRRMRVLLFGGKGAIHEIELHRGRADIGQLFSLLFHAFHGGTDIDGPVVRALALRETAPYRRADLLLVTDGVWRMSPPVAQRLQQARARDGFEVVSVAVGGRGQAMSGVSDVVWSTGPGVPDAARGLRLFE